MKTHKVHIHSTNFEKIIDELSNLDFESFINTHITLMGYYRNLRPTSNKLVFFRAILFVETYTKFLMFERETLSYGFTLETT